MQDSMVLVAYGSMRIESMAYFVSSVPSVLSQVLLLQMEVL